MNEQPEYRLIAICEYDVPEVARMNFCLIRDEGSGNPMQVPELEIRMHGFLSGGYQGVLIHAGGDTAGYCLWRPEEGAHGGPQGIYLRQYYIKPQFRRHGIGRAALRQIMTLCFAGAAFVSLDVLECNAPGRAFWADFGFKAEYTRMTLKL